MLKYGKLKGELLSEKVYKILKDSIVEQKLKPGQKVSDFEIAKDLGISRTPVREAIQHLSAKGLLVQTPNQGVVVARVELNDVKEVLEIRSVLEGLAARLCVQKIEDHELITLKELFKKMTISAEQKEVVKYSKRAEEFHNFIFTVAGNKRLTNFRNMACDIQLRYGLKSLMIPGRVEKSLEEHKNILDAILKRDEVDAEKCSETHVLNVIENLQEHKPEQ